MNIKNIIEIIGVGVVTSLLFTLMFYLLFSQLVVDFIINNLSNNYIIFTIIFGLFGISIITSMITGFLLKKDISNLKVLQTAILSVLSTVLFLFCISYIFAFFRYKYIFINLRMWEILLSFPQVLFYFSIYVLPNFFSLIIMFIVIYFMFYAFFLSKITQSEVYYK